MAEMTPVVIEQAVQSLQFGRERSLLNEQRARGGRGNDFQQEFPAEAIDPAQHLPVRVTAAYQIGGQPLLWFRPGFDAAVIDASHAGPLRRVDATNLVAGEEHEIGRFTPDAIAALGPERILRFLLEAGIIGSYVHIGSQLRCEAPRAAQGFWEQDCAGSHEYFTSRHHEGRLSFTVRIAADGTVRLRGR